MNIRLKPVILICLVFLVSFIGYQKAQSTDQIKKEDVMEIPQGSKTAVFAGGCFWCVESDFEKIDGVIEAISGYSGGTTINPTYKDVSYGKTDHIESVKVIYDPLRITYDELLDVFWRHVNPTDAGGQFSDRGPHYRTIIFYADKEEMERAENSLKKMDASGLFNASIVTEILERKTFYPAETYHQNYYKKKPSHYKRYRTGSGRDHYLKKKWGDTTYNKEKKAMDTNRNPKLKTNSVEMSNSGDKTHINFSNEALKEKLTPLQYKVTQKNGTEPAFKNEFWDNHEEGIYVDVVSGEPLFSSTDKFDSGSGWPSFTKPLVSENIVEKKDRSFFMVRIEARSRKANSHLGHVFNDGPKPDGIRYCINSAALRFIKKDHLLKEGHGAFLHLFE